MSGAFRPDRLGGLFDRLAGALVLYARQWCDRGEAEDVVQEAFLALSREGVWPDSPESWLYRVVRNRAISTMRGATRRRRRESVVSSRDPWFTEGDDRLDAQEATALLASLQGESRETIVARLWGGLTFEEIGGLLGCSTATAYRRYHEGLARLQERMDQPCTPTTRD